MGFLVREEKENLLIEYNLLREGIADRGYKTWVVNAILILGSLLVAFVPGVENFPTPVISLVLVVSALILHVTSVKVTAISYNRMEEIAAQLKITGPKKMFETKIAGKGWFSVRKNLAYVLFTILIAIYVLLILINFFV